MLIKLVFFLLTTLSALESAHADTPPPGVIGIKGGTDNTVIGNTGDSLKVNVTNSAGSTVTQGPQGSPASPWWVDVVNFPSTQVVSGTVAATQSGSWTVGATISNFPATQAVTQSGSWTVGINNFPSIQQVAGTITATQTNGNNLHVNVDNPISIPTPLPVTGNFFQSVQPVSFTTPVPVTISTPLPVTIPTPLPVSQSGTWTVGATVSNFPSVQPVSQSGAWSAGRTWSLSSGSDSVTAEQGGTWTVQQGSAPWSVSQSGSWTSTATQSSGSNLHVDVDNTVPVSIASPLPVSFSTPVPVTGTINANITNASIPVTGTFWQSVQPVSFATPLPVSFSTPVPVTGTFFQATQPVSGTVTANAGTGTFNVNVTNNVPVTVQTPLPVTVPTPLPVSQSGAWTNACTQSGTWTVQQGTPPWSVSQSGTWNVGLNAGSNNVGSITNITGTVSLPTGAATSANQATEITDLGNINTSIQNTQGSVTSGTAGTKSDLVGMVFATPTPTPTNGQQLALQSDSTGNLKVDLATSVPAGSNTIGGVTQSTSPWVDNITQFGGTNISTGTGAGGAGIPRVTVSNDSNVLATQSGSWTVTANEGGAPWSQNITQIGSNTVSTAGPGTQRVGIVGNGGSTLDASPGSPQPTNALMLGGSDGGNIRALATDTSGDAKVIGSVASLVLDSGNPVKVGGFYQPLPYPTPSPTASVRINAQVNRFGETVVIERNTYSHIAGATTVTVKSGAGFLHSICQNTTGNAETISIFDNTAGSGTTIGIMTPSQAGRCEIFDVEFNTGLTIVQTAAASDTTVSYH